MANTSATSPGTMADDSTIGTVAWSNPNNAKVSDGVYATAVTTTDTDTHYLKATNPGFSIPSGATINGIKIEVLGYFTSDGTLLTANAYQGNSVVKNGTIIGITPVANNFIGINSPSYKTYGSSTDLWGETWTPADINDVGFGTALTYGTTQTGRTLNFFIDHIRTTVYYTEASTHNPAFAHRRLLL